MPLAVGLVHAQEVAGEEGGFGAACAGAELEEAGEVGERVRREERGFETGGKGC